ncbi:exosortase A [Parasphingopyxis lamellibrachiae]|uniref:Exosortase A n=1 Tax=Parasphingopyxis lamellibrachiae TaxID=680125 RepID=A0A3D9FD33_9SPHN|nr:exosortase A [Parasphingopyxis lamellibrachiae]RED15663.1 exosortase A [Parasphingopyxis lamellibrachiae]
MSAAEALYRPETTAAAGPWRRHLSFLAFAALAMLLIFHRDVLDMVSIWWTSSTFNHCLVILPIIGWLVWNRRNELAQLTPSVSPLGYLIVAGGAVGWLLGEAAGVSLARHFGVVLMLQGSVVTILGIAVTRGLLFPLAFALFLVPFGEEFVPFLQSITAELSMLLLGLFGLPAHIEGVFITTPSGYFEVAEACSGVKFLIAMVALGALAANLCFKSWWKRAAFLGICVAVPIMANGIRAFGTIYIADRNGIEFAEGFDHVVYGWFFFAFVIIAVLALGWKFFDREIDDPAFDPGAIADSGAAASPVRLGAFALALLTLAAAPMLWLSTSAITGSGSVPASFTIPRVEGWTRTDAQMGYPWQATYAGADRIVEGRYSDANGRVVDIAIAYFANQTEGRELVSFGQGGLPVDTEWSRVEDTDAPPSGHAYRITAPGPEFREVFEYMRIGTLTTGSESRAKIETMRARLLGGDQSAIGIVLSAEGRDARDIIESFLADSGGIETLVDRVTGLAD